MEYVLSFSIWDVCLSDVILEVKSIHKEACIAHQNDFTAYLNIESLNTVPQISKTISDVFTGLFQSLSPNITNSTLYIKMADMPFKILDLSLQIKSYDFFNNDFSYLHPKHSPYGPLNITSIALFDIMKGWHGHIHYAVPVAISFWIAFIRWFFATFDDLTEVITDHIMNVWSVPYKYVYMFINIYNNAEEFLGATFWYLYLHNNSFSNRIRLYRVFMNRFLDVIRNMVNICGENVIRHLRNSAVLIRSIIAELGHEINNISLSLTTNLDGLSIIIRRLITAITNFIDNQPVISYLALFMQLSVAWTNVNGLWDIEELSSVYDIFCMFIQEFWQALNLLPL